MRSNVTEGKRQSKIRRAIRSIAVGSSFETLEHRQLLAGNVYDVRNTPVFAPGSSDLRDVKGGPLAKGGQGLIGIFREYQNFIKNGGNRNAFQSSYANLYQIRGRNIGVTLRTRGSVEALASVVKQAGGVVEYKSKSRNVVIASVPISQVDDLAARPEIMHVRPLARAVGNSVGDGSNAAEEAQKNALITAPFGATGAGQRVGVISDSFDALGRSYSVDVLTGDLPSDVHVLADDPTGEDEGRAMLQLVHDLAPDAGLSFHAVGSSQLDYADAVRALAEDGSTVISDDVLFPDEPFFQPGVLDRAIQDVVDDGVSYFTSANNYGASGYQHAATFVPDANGEQAVDFDPSSKVDTTLSIHMQQAGQLYFQWDNPYDGVVGDVTSDLDLYLYRNGALIASATDDNFATGVPTETMLVPNAGEYQIVIREHSLAKGASQPTLFKFIGNQMFDARTGVEYTDATSTSTSIGHEVSRDAIVVGAVPYDATDAFGHARSIENEDFSASATIIQAFDASGNRLQEQRTFPGAIVSGVDGISTTVSGFAPFFGTSAASPNVAALAAQLRQINPDATTDDVRRALIESSKRNPLNDQQVGKRDIQAGYGLVDATYAANAVKGTIPIATLELPTTSSGKLSSVAVSFSERVTGVDIDDFILTRDGTGGDRFVGSESIRSTDNGRTYLIENLSSATQTLGVYTLTLKGAGTGIHDAAGNVAAGQVGSVLVTLRRPQELAAAKLDDGQIRLRWTDLNTEEDGYRIQRATDKDFTQNLRSFSVGVGVNEYVDRAAEIGEAYYYRVRAVKGDRVGDVASVSIVNGSTGEIFVDNAAAKYSGSWETFDDDAALLGSYARATATDAAAKPKTATFATTDLATGQYFLYVRYNANAKNANNASFEVYRGGKLATTVKVDQRTRGGGWVLLGKFLNSDAQRLSVRLTTKLADGAVNADAVRFLPADETTVAAYVKKHRQD